MKLDGWEKGEFELAREDWDCGRGVSWPPAVTQVHVIKVGPDYFAVGKDPCGKVRKPSTYTTVSLAKLIPEVALYRARS